MSTNNKKQQEYGPGSKSVAAGTALGLLFGGALGIVIAVIAGGVEAITTGIIFGGGFGLVLGLAFGSIVSHQDSA